MLNISTASQGINAIAIGGFDGMHVGHQELFRHLGENGGILVIETGYANLTPKIQRQMHSKSPLFFYELNDIKSLEGAEFIQMLKRDFPKLNKIVVGYDFHFGSNRRYNTTDLRKLFDGEVLVVDEVLVGDISVHSRKIRKFLAQGNISAANFLLGYDYHIRGEVVAGQGIGKKELVATINIESNGYMLPKEGVYAAFTRVDNELNHRPSVAFVGHRFTTDGSFAVETHILDKNILKQPNRVTLYFVAFIRDNMKFDSLGELKNAIDSDIKLARKHTAHLAL